MSASKSKAIGAWVVPILLLAATNAFAQGTADEDEDLMPAVDTSVIESAATEDVPPVLDEDVTRQTTGSRVMDSLELGRTEITGNQELPKVLYIVPWKKSNPGDLMSKPVNTLLDEVLAPIDREEFTRRVNYYDDLYGDDDE